MQNDATYLAIIVGLFVCMFLLVKACDRIIGSDEEAMADEQAQDLEQARDDRTVAA